ncbi:MAG: peptide deformylase [Planctomyces sp.]|nr:peptide deformylase [Planctomyces sp.]MBA4119388.1 peptide deformylase [Isosphaera sp.]
MPIDPGSLRLVHYPDPVLRFRARPVPQVNAHVLEVAQRMIELMAQHEGIGLAAPQVGLPWRLFVCHVPAVAPSGDEPGRSPHDNPPTATAAPAVYINPVLREPSAHTEMMSEGCLSLPEIAGGVVRPEQITIEATGADGALFTARSGGLLARCWQHEQDHLDGRLIIDRFTTAAREKARAALRRLDDAARK